MKSKRCWKLFWAWDFDKEEAWLREMANSGWALSSVGFLRYDFEPCNPGEYITRLELLEDMPSDPKSIEYIRFVEETGAEYIGSVLRWAYFRKKADGADFDLFSDRASRIAHLKRVIRLVMVLAPLNAGIGLLNVSQGHWIGLLNLVVTALLFVGIANLRRRCQAMEEESRLYE